MNDYVKAILYGIVEGITEWLPISSTGHLILFGEVLKLNVSDAFMEMFDIVIQLGAILAVVCIHFREIYPFASEKNKEQRRKTLRLWMLIGIAIFPSALAGLLMDDLCNTFLSNPPTVAFALIAFGVIFIILERYHKAEGEITMQDSLSWKNAIKIGLFQTLSIIPGTSRSGATMIGGMWSGLSRALATKFSFFMAIPTMLGYSGLKVYKYFADGNCLTLYNAIIISVGFLSSLIVSLCTIRWLTSFVRNHTFLPFGIYRIFIGIIILVMYY